MATLFESTLNLNTLRPPPHDTRASMADTLPSINFGFEELRGRMAAFTARFDDFIERGRKRVLEDKEKFYLETNEAQEDQKLKRREMEITALKQQRHDGALARESAEAHEMHAAIAELESHRAAQAAKRDTLKAELAGLQATLGARRDAQGKHARALAAQTRHNVPELRFWEEQLCLRIEGVAGDAERLRFVFSHVCERDWDREAWFELDTSASEYGVARMEPKLEEAEVAGALDTLNEGRDLRPFFKAMRESFVKAMK